MPQGEVFEYGYRNGRQLSHFLVDVTSAGRGHLLNALAIAFSIPAGFSFDERFIHATHMLAQGSWQLTFACAYNALDLPWKAFAKPVDVKAVAQMTWEWLEQADYGADEHDGASYKGWRVFNHQFGIVDNNWHAFVAVRPMWIYLPK